MLRLDHSGELSVNVTDGNDVVARFFGAAARVFSAAVDERRALEKTSLDDVIHRASVMTKSLDHTRLVLHTSPDGLSI